MKLFVHIPKNGGMTIRKNMDIRKQVLLAQPDHHINRKYTKGLVEKMKHTKDHEGYEHAPLRYWRSDLRDQFRAVAIVRNPWDRVVSRYLFAKKVILHEGTQPPEYADISSFEAFLEERHKWGGEEYMWHRAVRNWYPSHFHVADENGNVKCDILRFENYNDDVKQYFGTLANPEPRNITRVPNDKGKTGHGIHYKDIYTPETIQIVADWYKQDVDYWGFDFDTGPTRNYWNRG
jgi:hypothetical protein